ncbi:helix-turn-helix domain-containing protein (plasmid) [Skermanella sp. TT6]|uniref:Helix-turn-helix domain-containing protein n=1 Tax=Skermanella cutis TaxID=2775420 RepID=A0ABX7BH66_9PROT|nr:helix-turn-helix domain-containing protein [Skermanella sp. TT6]QQP93485.1 helix-turn-helix domain-containing protein [Skermanella sp. TT6]
MGAHSVGSRWGTVAASVMRRPGLSVAAKAVYAALATYADRVGWIWVRQETIASDLERSRAWVHAAIAELEAQGLILHDRQYIEGRQRASRYRLQDGMARRAEAGDGTRPGIGTAAEVSEGPDAAVEPADTSHHDESTDSRKAGAGESAQPVREAARPVAADWVPTGADVAWARTRHPDLDVLAFTESFVLSCQAKGYRYADPSAAWRRWLLEPKGGLPLLNSQNACPQNARRSPDQESSHGNRTHETVTPAGRQRGDSRRFPSESGRKPQVAAGRGPDPDIADRNRERAAACLDRLLGRRAGDPSAGHAR